MLMPPEFLTTLLLPPQFLTNQVLLLLRGNSLASVMRPLSTGEMDLVNYLIVVMLYCRKMRN